MALKIEFGTGSRFGRLSYKKASSLIKYAIQKGIKKFDTGNNYGNWLSEPLLGECLKEFLKQNREDFIISSKAGTVSKNNKHTKNFDPEYIESSIMNSLKNLNTSYLDYFYLHGPNLSEIKRKGLLQKLKKLKKTGLIKNIGINTHDIFLIEKISNGVIEEIDSLLLDYNLIQQDRDNAIKNCFKNKINVVAGTALCQGLLLQSRLGISLRTLSPFYIGRMYLKESTYKHVYNAKKVRKYLQENYPSLRRDVPLSFVLNSKFIDSIPIGMLSKKSIDKNINIANNPVSKTITNKIGSWCKLNTTIRDS